MRKNIVAGNWKMNKNLQEGLALATELNEALKNKTIHCDVIIAPPFIHLASVVNAIDTTTIGVSAQNCADKPEGAYTGEVSQNDCIDRGQIRDYRSQRTPYLLSRNARNPERKGIVGTRQWVDPHFLHRRSIGRTRSR